MFDLTLSTVWNPVYQIDIDNIKKKQKKVCQAPELQYFFNPIRTKLYNWSNIERN